MHSREEKWRGKKFVFKSDSIFHKTLSLSLTYSNWAALQRTCIHKWFTINLEIIPSDYGQFTFIYFLWRVIPLRLLLSYELSRSRWLIYVMQWRNGAHKVAVLRWCEKILQLKAASNIIRMSPLGNVPFKKKKFFLFLEKKLMWEFSN